jgi:hypothetical protein
MRVRLRNKPGSKRVNKPGNKRVNKPRSRPGKQARSKRKAQMLRPMGDRVAQARPTRQCL